MATTKLYLDTRAVADGKPAPVKIRISHNASMAMMSTGVFLLPSQWDAVTGSVKAHDRRKVLNLQLVSLKTQVDDAIFDLRRKGELPTMKAADIKRYAEGRVHLETPDAPVLYIDVHARVRDAQRTDGSKSVFDQTLTRMRAYDPDVDTMPLDSLDVAWLNGFDKFLSKTNSRNSRNVYYRTIRTCFNAALDDELTTSYPFRKFKIRNEVTKDKALNADDLRTLFAYPCADWQQEYVDMFKLMFLLIGINAADLCLLQSVTSGRIEYQRQKTHKHYSVAVLPEAAEIIERYRGKKALLSVLDRYADYKDYLHHLNNALKTIGKTYENGKKATGDALFPNLSSGYARTTWATIATELDIPRETISAALGHSVVDVTTTYIRLAWRKKVDEANRKVADYVLYNKR